MRQKALGRKHSEDTKLLMSSKRGSSVNIYEKCEKEGFKLIGSFVSARKAGKFLGISGSTIVRYLKSKEIFKEGPHINFYLNKGPIYISTPKNRNFIMIYILL